MWNKWEYFEASHKTQKNIIFDEKHNFQEIFHWSFLTMNNAIFCRRHWNFDLFSKVFLGEERCEKDTRCEYRDSTTVKNFSEQENKEKVLDYFLERFPLA